MGCASPTPSPTATPAPTLTPSATPTPAPTPTATPIPPLTVDIRWPEQVSALEPVPIEVAVIPPPGISVTTSVYASMLDPQGQTYWQGLLAAGADDLHTSAEAVHLPLEPAPGDWRLLVALHAPLPAVGEQTLAFRPVPVAFHDLEGRLTPGIDIRVPWDFAHITGQGDEWAGAQAWQYGDGMLELWWAPGPAEPLLWNSALAMLESTHDPGTEIEIQSDEEMTWEEQPAFLFREMWQHDDVSSPAEALVVQGPDDWLYVLRVRALAGEEIPPLMRQVRDTFVFEKTGE